MFSYITHTLHTDYNTHTKNITQKKTLSHYYLGINSISMLTMFQNFCSPSQTRKEKFKKLV